MSDLAVIKRALKWLERNDLENFYNLKEALANMDVESAEELVAGVPDSESGRVPAGGDSVDDEQYGELYRQRRPAL